MSHSRSCPQCRPSGASRHPLMLWFAWPRTTG
jgi:hypothetical protein